MKKYTTLFQTLAKSYSSWKVQDLTSRRFPPEVFHRAVDRITGRGREMFAVKEVGLSFEGRPIRLIALGGGKTKVLLWSQMHGDESTATMAIADLLNFFSGHVDEETAGKILTNLELFFLPMVNPDGAVRFQRRTAQGIDMNRDALALQTPEAQILKRVHQDHMPAFAYNLHDQELSTIGTSKELAAIAVLAPLIDEEKSENSVRRRAQRLAASFIKSMDLIAPGKIARYGDTFEPRAFGDNMQRWGTSTILIESGHTFNDPEKQFIRQLNAIGILSSLSAIATGEYRHVDPSLYKSLPLNGKQAYDLIIRDVRIQHVNGKPTKADLGISYQVDTHTEETPMLVDVGDLSTFVGLREIDGREATLAEKVLSLGRSFPWNKFFPP